MRSLCPSRFAVPELGVLQPGVLVALGEDAFKAVRLLRDGGTAWSEDTGQFMRGTLALPHADVTVLWLYHPTSRGDLWQRSQDDVSAIWASDIAAAATTASSADRAAGRPDPVRDRHAHVGVAEVRERGAVAELDEAVDDRLRGWSSRRTRC